MEILFQKLGLNPRRRLPSAKAIFKLLELQIAVTKYYFTTTNLLTIMDCFMQDDTTQVRICHPTTPTITATTTTTTDVDLLKWKYI